MQRSLTRSPGPARRCCAATLALVLVAVQVACPPRAEASHLGASTVSAGSAPPPSVTLTESFQPDLFTGRAVTSVPIVVAPGRRGMQPNLALAYSSTARNGLVGVGWTLDMGYVERSTKRGVPHYDASDVFAFLLQGVSSDLVKIPDGTYRAAHERAFLRFAANGVDGWEVRDPSGTRYLFGGTAESELRHPDGQVFRWLLRRAIDVSGNYLDVAYTQDQGQAYPSEIRYTGHAPTALAPAQRVAFTYETRTDVERSWRSGHLIRTAKRLQEIAAYAGEQLARKYRLAYTESARTSRSLLASVTLVGSDGVTTLPPQRFTYEQREPTYTRQSSATANGQPHWNIQTKARNVGSDNYGCLHPYATLFDEPALLDQSGTSARGTVSWTVGAQGQLLMHGSPHDHVHTWTYVYANQPKTLNLNVHIPGVSSNACMWVEDVDGLRAVDYTAVGVKAGWSIINLTDYNEPGAFGYELTQALSTLVDNMNPTLSTLPTLMGDVNGDGISDLIKFSTTATSAEWRVALGTGEGFRPEALWLTGLGSTGTTPLIGDFDGDGRADIAAVNAQGQWRFATSDGTKFVAWDAATLTFAPGATPLAGDWNGDGRADLAAYTGGAWQFALATGSGFTPTPSLNVTWGDATTKPTTGDWNGDGLTDIGLLNVVVSLTVRSATGTGFAGAVEWTPGLRQDVNTGGDLNGDGRSDFSWYSVDAGAVCYMPSLDEGVASWRCLPPHFTMNTTNDELQLGDVNGDGIVDPAIFNASTGRWELALSNGPVVDVLTGVDNGLGGTTTLTYTRSTDWPNLGADGRPALPFVLPVVTQATASDGMGHTYTTRYTYEGGRYDAPTKEFRGFRKVQAIDADGNVTETLFLQGEFKQGSVESTEIRDAHGTRLTRQANTWQCAEIFPGVHVVSLAQTNALIYDNAGASKETMAQFTYDGFGNVRQTIEMGDVSVTGDERATTTDYVYNTSAWILNTPAVTRLTSLDGTTVFSERTFFYDGNTAYTGTDPATGGRLPQTALTLVRLTKDQRTLDAGVKPSTAFTYDAFGNVLTVTDALGRVTTTAYDAGGTYLTQVANALGHTRTFAYDPRWGAVTSATDPNGMQMKTTYDALGRVTQTSVVDTSTIETVMSRITYALNSLPVRTTTTIYAGANLQGPVTTYQFMDGLGRTIQVRAPAADPAKQVVTGAVELNNRGLVAKQWAAYLDKASTSYVPMGTVPGLAPPVTYAYDTLGRLTTVTGPDGAVTQTSYAGWSTTMIDANQHKTRRTNDAYGRLKTVEEFNGAEVYTTAYQYDTPGRLTKVTDAKGNVTTMAYDALGRKTGMDDPDMRHWTYAYNAVDNLISQTDARGVTMAFVYDALNRLTQKSYTIPAGFGIANPGNVTYKYDEPASACSKGRLSSLVDGVGKVTFQYDLFGRLLKEMRIVNGAGYIVVRAYDLLGRLLALTYPDGTQALYTYNAQGGIDTIRLQPTSGAAQSIVSRIDYNAAGQLLKIVYGNGVVTDYTYNPQTLRLDGLRSAGSAGTLQDFAYAFDGIGNVTAVTDRVHTAGQSFQYDGLNRLTLAAGAYGTRAYAYDAIGNMTSKEGVAMRYGERGTGPHAVTSTDAGLTMSYDANGNMTAQTSSSTNRQMTYDAENRLVTVETPQTATRTITFQPGWNFFALPVVPADRAVAAILPSFATNFEQVARFDSATQSFAHYTGTAAFDDFTTLEYGTGYQVYCKATGPVTVTITGTVPTAPLSSTLAAGWQLLPALTQQETATPASVFGGLSYDQLLRYDSAASPALATATSVRAGAAYYVHLTAAATWQPAGPPATVTRFIYDGDGGRVQQQTAAGTTTFLGEMFEQDPAGVTTRYVFAGGLRVAAQVSTGALRFYHTDHLGSSNVITNATGAVIEVAEYTPYGSTSRHEGATPVPQQFTGQRLDGTGLYFYHARYYDPAIGRFLSADPTVQAPGDPQDLNRYTYCRNNPINLVDPSGYGFWKNFFTIVAAVIAIAIVPEGAPLWMALAAGVIGAGVGYGVGTGAEAISGAIGGGSSGGGAGGGSTGPVLNTAALQDTGGRFFSPPTSASTAGAAAGTHPQGSFPSALQSNGTGGDAGGLLLTVGQELAHLDAGTADSVARATMPVEVYARPAIGNVQHMLFVYDNGTKLWELTRTSKGRIHFNKPDTKPQVDKYFNDWTGKLKGPLTLTVDKAKFEQDLAAQEAREGDWYNPFYHNSNYAARWVIYHSIVYGTGDALNDGLGWAPDFFGDPAK